MFDQYSEKARRAVFFSRYEAWQFGAEAIECEHLLLGIAREDKYALNIASKAAIDHEILKSTIEKQLGKVSIASPRPIGIVDKPLSEAVQQIIVQAINEAQQLNVNRIDIEHLLLSLLRNDRGLAAHILAEQGVTYLALIEKLKEIAIEKERLRRQISISGTTQLYQMVAQMRLMATSILSMCEDMEQELSSTTKPTKFTIDNLKAEYVTNHIIIH